MWSALVPCAVEGAQSEPVVKGTPRARRGQRRRRAWTRKDEQFRRLAASRTPSHRACVALKLAGRRSVLKPPYRCARSLLRESSDPSLMSPSRQQRIGGLLALCAGVGCATAIVDEDPVDSGNGDGSAAAAATGGTTVAASGGGTASSGGTSGTTSGGTTGTPSGGGSTNVGAAGRGGRSGAGGSFAAAGLGNPGSAGSAAGSSAIATCPAPRMPEQPGAAQGNSGSFDTTEAVCYFVEGTFNTWNCSNIAGRTVTINGMPSMCGGSLPDKIDGGYYFEFGAASDGTNYTSFYWYTS